MKKHLNLSIEESVIKEMKILAIANGLTVSDMVALFFKYHAEHGSAFSLSPEVVKSEKGVSSFL